MTGKTEIKKEELIHKKQIEEDDDEDDEVSEDEEQVSFFQLLSNFCLNVIRALTHPERAWIWIMIILIISLYNFLGVTFRCTYLYHYRITPSTDITAFIILLVVDLFCDSIYLIDIISNFFRPYAGQDGLLVYQLNSTALNYINIFKIMNNGGWFILDFLTWLPLDYIMIFAWPTAIPFFRLNRALRVGFKFFHYFAHFENYLNISAAIIRIVKFVLIMLLITHLVACFWYVVSISEEPQKTIMWTSISDMPFRAVPSIYLYAFHWCLTTMTGYGGTVPSSLNQVIYSEFVVCIGVALYVTVIGTVGSLVTNLDSNAAKNRQRLDAIKEYMKYRKLPKELSQKIVNYYTFLFKSRKGWDEEKILSDLPQYLRMEVALDMNKRIVEKVELFKNTSRMFISSVVLSLMPRMCLPGATIVRQGEIGREMYFIASGTVHILVNGNIVAHLQEGTFFGEIALIYDSPRSATATAGTYCDLYVLTKDMFDRIAQDYPDQVAQIKAQAAKRREEAKKKNGQKEIEEKKETKVETEEELTDE